MIGTIASVGDRGLAWRAALVFWVTTAATAATLGLALVTLVAPLALMVDHASRHAVIALAFAFALGVDAGYVHVRLPFVHRQVSSLDWFRGPVAASASWGVQLGIGVATFVPSAGLYALLAYAALAGSAVGAIPLLAYGVIRGAQPALGLLGLDARARRMAVPRARQAAVLATLCMVLGTVLFGVRM